jgi:hypothetical protein
MRNTLHSALRFLSFRLAILICATAVAWGQESAVEAPAAMETQHENVNRDADPNAPSATAKTSKSDECEQPEPTFSELQYNGPFKKFAGHLAGKPEIRTVQHPHDHSGKMICSLPVRQKFMLFTRDTFEPATFILAGFDAGISQASNDDPTFGQGAEGFGRRYGAAFADRVSSEFFGTFLYPTILHEDPRYFRMGHGPKTTRFIHAFNHAFVTHTDTGKHTFNFSEWLGAGSTTALGNLYHPGNLRGFQPAARRTAYTVLFDVGFDVIREFWPEVTHHLRLPFITHTQPQPPK